MSRTKESEMPSSIVRCLVYEYARVPDGHPMQLRLAKTYGPFSSYPEAEGFVLVVQKEDASASGHIFIVEEVRGVVFERSSAESG